jgi:hypothetical protein
MTIATPNGRVLAYVVMALLPTIVCAEQLRIPVVADNSIVLHHAELDINQGRNSQIRIKGNQHIVAMNFDWSALKGLTVKRATLVCRKGRVEIAGLTISTIQSPWNESQSTALTSGVSAFKGWGWPGGLFPALCGGNSFSRLCQSPSRLNDGWYHWRVEPDLVHACAIGSAYGLALHEWDVDYSRNPTIYSREQGNSRPYLLVETGPSERAPAVPKLMQDAEQRLRIVGSAFAYVLRVDGVELPRWNTPFESGVVPLRDIPLSESMLIEAVGVSRSGQRSKAVRLKYSKPFVRLPELPQPTGEGLRAARGEVLGLDVVTRTAAPTVVLEGVDVAVWQALKVKGKGGDVYDPLMPVTGGGGLFCVDLRVSGSETRDTIEGSMIVDGKRQPLTLHVRPFALPERPSFACEMNSYGVPDRVQTYYELQRIARNHRCHVNILHYSHRTAAAGARKCNLDMKLWDGRRMNEARYNAIQPGASKAYWNDFVTAFDRHLQSGPPGFYLTFHESWPLNMRPHWNGNMDAYEAFSKPYEQTFVNILADFGRVAGRHAWRDAGLQIYLNNKGTPKDPTKQPWILDEPSSYWDYRALAYYGDLVKQSTLPNLRYRIDISRPQFTRGQLRDKAALWVVGSDAFRTYPRLLADRREREGTDMWIYGTTPAPERPVEEVQAWVMEAYRRGATGVVPWQTVDKKGSSLTTANALGLFIFDHSGDALQIRHSRRLRGYRRAEQDIEYLELLRRKREWSREQLEAFIDHYLTFKGEFKSRYSEDAGAIEYAGLRSEDFTKLREAAAVMIAGD